MLRTTTHDLHTPCTVSETATGRGSDAYEAWMDRLLAEAPEFGPQTTLELQAAFAPYLPAEVHEPMTPETEMDLPHAA